jgi:acetyl esterase/lipase
MHPPKILYGALFLPSFIFAQYFQYTAAAEMTGQAPAARFGRVSNTLSVEKIALWPGQAAPGALGTSSADTPYVTVYRPPANVPVAGAMLFCPGGGYIVVVTDEPQWAVDYFLPKGWIIAVLQYRTRPYCHPVPLWDVQRAMRLLRSRAKSWRADPDKIVLMGCSAGGHLAATLATHFDAGDPIATDPIDRIGCKPFICVLAYPIISMDTLFTHMGSRLNLIGNTPPQALVDSLSIEKQVTLNTPPCFLVHGTVDTMVPWKNSRVFYDSCVAHQVAAKFYSITDSCGSHGFSYDCGNNWIDTCHAWLRGFLDAAGIRERARGADRSFGALKSANAGEQERLFDILGRVVASGWGCGVTPVMGKNSATGVYLAEKNACTMPRKIIRIR